MSDDSDKVLEKFLPFLEDAYHNFRTPDFEFAKKRFAERPYDRLIKRLRDYAVVEECTEAEEDVCFGYFLKGRNALWKLDLSLVGPFGIFVRLSSRITEADFIDHKTPDLIQFERKILEILRSAGIRILVADELRIPVPLTLPNTPKGMVRLYQALFSDRANLPWEQ